MKVYKDYRKLENINELRIYDLNEKKLYQPTPMEFHVDDVPFPQLISNVPMDVNIFIPHNDGNDFIIKSLGDFILNRGNLKQEDVKGRLLSKISPIFYGIFHEYFTEVYRTQKTKEMRVFYYGVKKLSKITNVKIIYEMNRLFVLADHIGSTTPNLFESDLIDHAEDKANLMEYFTQTGSYRKVGGKYTWTQGIYNIINRPRDEHDDYHNIVFDLAIPEDKKLIERILKIMDTDVGHHEDIIRIKTDDGTLKYLEINLYSNFDENGNLISRYGMMNDITKQSQSSSKPVDFLLNGFKNSKKLALLIEPLNTKHYEFSQGFYYFIHQDPKSYVHSIDVIKHIVEDSTKEQILKLVNGEVDTIDETFTYYVDGDERNLKICELYIERFEFGNQKHSIGFLADITDERNKQLELRKSNDYQVILIKEVHHRVKNNLQVLNSFLNLEKRAYRNNPEVVIDHMQARLTSLALLHEKTYNTRDFKNINLKDFIDDQDLQLKTLVGIRDNVEFESNVDKDLHLTIEVITPLLLIMDELTMNAIKHAFPDKSGRNNKITKTITKIDKDHAKMVFKDNGQGIENPDNVTTNLGWEIIKNLTKQLDGEIKLTEHKNGTEYTLIFPMGMKHTIHG
ncbi:sensor histidine kinase [Methanobrevibacter sp.]|uniref:PAS domain-containing sensor histidine kinase n=1 Tax=Methanobrevibacter sp. TaxID=66852 RepID=UPI0026E04873|nr:sensor histidine kinase [Methanobrevibacter sp.]MDO5859127.1 sensor histidine kinase [Methanobrevibacter sp.]